jgi:methylated-DNA-[protein]-cysteine S-methyltransferase
VAVTPHRDAIRHREAVAYRYAVAGWGVGEIVTLDGVLLAHSLPSRRRRLSPPARGPQGGARTPEVTVSPDSSQVGDAFVAELCRRFADHLGGKPVSYEDVEVDVGRLSAFQQELVAAARSIEWGEVVTYGGLAALAGRPRAARAAGSFCARNRLSLVVPCHRVVAAGREEPYELGGYGASGAGLKRRLLALEGTLL